MYKKKGKVFYKETEPSKDHTIALEDIENLLSTYNCHLIEVSLILTSTVVLDTAQQYNPLDYTYMYLMF